MMTKTLCGLTMLVAVFPLALLASQDQGPKISRDSVPGSQNPCQPCLFYTGDFDPSDQNASALSNENDLVAHGGTGTYQGFVVPKGSTWTITGVFMNVLATVSVIDPISTPWEIRTKPKGTYAGIQVVQGTANATFNPTGRSGLGLPEYTLLVTIDPVKLRSGEYIFNVNPQCSNTSDSHCKTARYFASDQTHQPGINAIGPPQPWDFAFFNSSFFNSPWAVTYGPSGAGGGLGCDQFSAGMLGTSQDEDSHAVASDAH
jgi:hypothetical protein